MVTATLSFNACTSSTTTCTKYDVQNVPGSVPHTLPEQMLEKYNNNVHTHMNQWLIQEFCNHLLRTLYTEVLRFFDFGVCLCLVVVVVPPEVRVCFGVDTFSGLESPLAFALKVPARDGNVTRVSEGESSGRRLCESTNLYCNYSSKTPVN